MWALIEWLRTAYEASGIATFGDDPEMENGQGLVEYALILILVAVVSMVMLVIVGGAVGNMFQNVVDQISGI